MPKESRPPDRRRTPLAAFTLLAVTVAATTVTAARLKPETLDAWTKYVQATERRIDAELQATDGFLALDFIAPDRARTDRRTLLRGEVVIDSMKTRTEDGRDIDIPSGTVEHWRGAIFVPGVSIDSVLEALRTGGTTKGQPDVLESRILERDGDSLRTYLKLRRDSLVTVTYVTEHAVRIARLSEDRLTSRSASTRIAEIENAGTSREREKPEGDDRGFLWRMNSYWRYEQVENGVLVEVESLTLSRSIPILLYPIARPIVTRAARGSLETTLTSLRTTLAGLPARAP